MGEPVPISYTSHGFRLLLGYDVSRGRKGILQKQTESRVRLLAEVRLRPIGGREPENRASGDREIQQWEPDGHRRATSR